MPIEGCRPFVDDEAEEKSSAMTDRARVGYIKGKEEPTSEGGGTVTYVLDKCAKEFIE